MLEDKSVLSILWPSRQSASEPDPFDEAVSLGVQATTRLDRHPQSAQ
jgi:hypothetical protein